MRALELSQYSYSLALVLTREVGVPAQGVVELCVSPEGTLCRVTTMSFTYGKGCSPEAVVRTLSQETGVSEPSRPHHVFFHSSSNGNTEESSW